MGWGIRARLLPLVVLFSFGLTPAVAHAAWSNLGAPLDTTTSNVQAPTVATVDGVPYVAWIDGGALLVKHWNGTAWVQDGGSLNVAQGSQVAEEMIAGIGGVPYVAFDESTGSGPTQLYVKHWNGSQWIENDDALNLSSGSAHEPWIADVGGVPYVAFVQQSSGVPATVNVEHWDAPNGAWVDDSINPLNVNSADDAFQPSIADVGGVPYVAFQENTGVGQYTVYVEHLSGGNWVQDGGAGGLNITPGDTAFTPTIAAVGAEPYVAFVEAANGGPQEAYVKHWNGTDWISDGGSLNPDPAGSIINGVALIDVGGTPYAASSEGIGTATQLFVERWTGAGWQPVGTPPARALAVSSAEGLANVGGMPFLASGQVLPNGTTAEVDVAALSPDFSSEQSLATDTGALLISRVKDYDTPLPIAFQYGPGSSLTSATAPQRTDGSGSSTIVQAVTGLSPSTGYSWRPFSSDGTNPIAFGPTQTFMTAAASGPGPAGPPGPTGQTGQTGQTGAPGKVELVTCKPVSMTVTRRVHGHKRKVKVTVQKCTAKLVSGPVKFTVASARAARLTRGKLVYARVEVLRSGRTLRLLVVHRVRRLTAGRYTLVSGRSRQAIQLGPLVKQAARR